MKQIEMDLSPGSWETETDVSADDRKPAECIRATAARTWTHEGWLQDAWQVAASCLRQNPRCKACRTMLTTINRRR